MKYVTLLCDGMADEPIPELDGKTPMEKARKPCMDKLFESSFAGLAHTIPDSLPAGSDVANLSVFGFPPEKYYTGRSPLEAMSMGLDMSDGEIAFRCNLVTLSGDGPIDSLVMEDFSAGEISSEEAHALISALSEELANDALSFNAGIMYRHCVLWMYGPKDVLLTPPHDIIGLKTAEYLPKGKGAKEVLEIIKKSMVILKQQPINLERISRGQNPGNAVWLWGQGSKPKLPNYYSHFGIHGAVVSTVDLIRGIGITAGMKTFQIPDSAEDPGANASLKAAATLKALKDGADFVYIHVETPDECGHQGHARQKADSISRIDKELLAPLIEGLKGFGEFRILIMPDHPTPVRLRTHTRGPVPFMIYDSTKNLAGFKKHTSFTENSCKTGICLPSAHTLADILFEKVPDVTFAQARTK